MFQDQHDWSLIQILIFSGDNCRVRDPRSGYEFDLSSLKGQDYQVRNDKYIYHLSVCGGLKRDICSHGTGSESVSSCQVEGVKQKIGGTQPLEKCHRVVVLVFVAYVSRSVTGMANQLLSYVGDQLILNYTNGETCHRIYQRSTEIYFSCHPDQHPVSFLFTKHIRTILPNFRNVT